MEPGSIASWASLIVSLSSFAFLVLTYRSKAASERVSALEKAVSDKASVGRMGAIEDRVDKVEDRTTKIEEGFRHLPSRELVHSIELLMRDVASQVTVLAERVKPIAATTDRMQEFLMEEAREAREKRASA